MVSKTRKKKKELQASGLYYFISSHSWDLFPLEIQPISRAQGSKDLIQAQAHVPKYRTTVKGHQLDSSVSFSLHRRV